MWGIVAQGADKSAALLPPWGAGDRSDALHEADPTRQGRARSTGRVAGSHVVLRVSVFGIEVCPSCSSERQEASRARVQWCRVQ